MNEELKTLKQDQGVSLAMNPKKFLVWLFIVSIVMIFGSLTSAYIVRQAEGNWKVFEMPAIFLYSTFVLLASSVTIHLAYFAVKRGDLSRNRLFLGFSFILAVIFLYMQLLGWKELTKSGVFFSFGNPSESFLYVLTGLHAFHLLTGIIFIIIVLISSFKQLDQSKRLLQNEMCSTYWHFLDGLWLYLYLFLMFNR
jgi:cytochrome c oxidase subunit III